MSWHLFNLYSFSLSSPPENPLLHPLIPSTSSHSPLWGEVLISIFRQKVRTQIRAAPPHLHLSPHLPTSSGILSKVTSTWSQGRSSLSCIIHSPLLLAHSFLLWKDWNSSCSEIKTKLHRLKKSSQENPSLNPMCPSNYGPISMALLLGQAWSVLSPAELSFYF